MQQAATRQITSGISGPHLAQAPPQSACRRAMQRTRGGAAVTEQPAAAEPKSAQRTRHVQPVSPTAVSAAAASAASRLASRKAAGSAGAARMPQGSRSQAAAQARRQGPPATAAADRSRSPGPDAAGTVAASRPQKPRSPAAQLRGPPPRLQRGVYDEATEDPMALPEMPAYQPRRDAGYVGRSEVTAAITHASRWEEVASVVDRRELDGVTLGAAFGHLAKLHAAAGATSDMPQALKASGLLDRMTARAVALAGMRQPLKGRSIAVILAAYPKLGVFPEEAALSALAKAAAQNLHTFAPGHIANTVRAFGALRFRPEGPLVADLADAAAAAAAKLSPYNIGSLAWGYARLCTHPGELLLEALERRIAGSAPDFKAAHLAEALWGFGTLGHTPRPETLQLLLAGVAASDGRDPPFGFRGQTAATALSGLAKLGVGELGWTGDAQMPPAGGAAAGAAAEGGADGSAADDGGGGGAADAVRVLTAALAAGAGDLNAAQLSQALSALARLPPEAAAAAQDAVLAVVAASASSFPPPLVCKALTAVEALAAAGSTAGSAPSSAWPALAEGGARSRLSAAAMQTVEDESSDEDAASMHRFVASLSDARQSLAAAEAAAAGGSSSGEEDPAFSSSDVEDFPLEGFPLDSGFPLPSDEDGAPTAGLLDSTPSEGAAHEALTALARQTRLTARRFEPAAMLTALRSFVVLAELAPTPSVAVAGSAAAAAGFLLPADVVDALAGDIGVRQLQFSRVERSEAGALLGRLAAAHGAGLASVQALAQ